MNNSHLSEEQVALFAEALNSGELSNLPESVVKHYKQCNECAQEVLFVSQISQDLDDVQTYEKQDKTNYFYWIGAAAAIVILFGIVQFFNSDSDTTKIVENSKPEIDSIKIEEKAQSADSANVLAEMEVTKKQLKPLKKTSKPETKNTNSENLLAYATNDDLEQLVERYKQGALRGDEISVKSPIHITSNVNDLTLEWTNTNQQELIVEFFNNKGEKLFEEITTDESLKLQKTEKKGLYYWKLINEDFDLLFCGKISLK